MAAGIMMHGARAEFTIEGVVVAMATGVDVTEINTVQRGKTLDSIRTTELVTTDYEVSVSVDLIRAVGKSPTGQLLFPKKGTSGDAHLKAICEHPALQAVIKDKITGSRLETVDGCVGAQYRRSYRRGSIAEGSMTFEAIVARDEGE